MQLKLDLKLSIDFIFKRIISVGMVGPQLPFSLFSKPIENLYLDCISTLIHRLTPGLLGIWASPNQFHPIIPFKVWPLNNAPTSNALLYIFFFLNSECIFQHHFQNKQFFTMLTIWSTYLADACVSPYFNLTIR